MLVNAKFYVNGLGDGYLTFQLEVPDEADENEIEDRVVKAAADIVKDEITVYWLPEPPAEEDEQETAHWIR
jgi:hypothetical protein